MAKYLSRELARKMLLTTVPQSKSRYAVVGKTCITEEPKQKLSRPETTTAHATPVQDCVLHCSFPVPQTSHLQRFLNKKQNPVTGFGYSTYF